MNRLTLTVATGALVLGVPSNGGATTPPPRVENDGYEFMQWSVANGYGHLTGSVCGDFETSGVTYCYALDNGVPVLFEAPIGTSEFALKAVAAAPPSSEGATASDPAAGVRTSFGSGHYIVGEDIQPGTYTTDASHVNEDDPASWCSVAVYSDLTATDWLHMDNLTVPGTYYVEVPAEAAVVEFEYGCTWTLVEDDGASEFVSTAGTDERCIRIELPEMPEDENLELTELPFYGQVWIPDNVREGFYEYGGRVILPCRDTISSDLWAHLVSGQSFVASGDFTADPDAIGGSSSDHWTLLYTPENDRDILGNVGRKWDLSMAVAQAVGCDNWPADMPLTDITIDCI